jgi:hypothetical protein
MAAKFSVWSTFPNEEESFVCKGILLWFGTTRTVVRNHLFWVGVVRNTQVCFDSMVKNSSSKFAIFLFVESKGHQSPPREVLNFHGNVPPKIQRF